MNDTCEVVMPCDSVLLNTFLIKSKKFRVYLHRGTLIWEAEGEPYSRCKLLLTDAIGIQYVHARDRRLCCTDEKTFTSGDVPVTGHTSFVLHYSVRGPKNKWLHKSVVMKHSDPRQVASWVKTIQNYLKGIGQRPKHIMVFINPYGGKRKGGKIFEKKVQPLFKVAGIQSQVIITQGPNHIQETLLSCPFDEIDAVVCIGGDGTFSEVFNSLVIRTAKDMGIDYNDPEVKLPSPQLRVGIVPGGSTDTMAYCFHGTRDVVTAVLHIIFGDSLGLDLCSIHSNGKLLRCYSSVISYGFLGDVLHDSEKFRWMGPKRYDYSGFKKFVRNKGYYGEVTLLRDPSDPSNGLKCYSNCHRCKIQLENIIENEDSNLGEWETFRGKFFLISGANVSCACERSPNGLSPYCHLGDGCIDILLIKHTHIFNNLKILSRMTSKSKTVFDLPFVNIYRAREFIFRALPSDFIQSGSSPAKADVSVWNCDGELQQEANIKIRSHCQLLQVFARGQEPVEDTTCLFC